MAQLGIHGLWRVSTGYTGARNPGTIPRRLVVCGTRLTHHHGTISALGEEPPADQSQCGYRAGGGGGAGGGIVIAADQLLGPIDATLRAGGGRGGEALGQVGNQNWAWAGGGGGGGRIKLFSPMNQFLGQKAVSGGLGGKFPATANSFGADPGANGTSVPNAVIPPVHADLQCG